MSKNLTHNSVRCPDVWAFVVLLILVLVSACASENSSDDNEDDADDDDTVDDDNDDNDNNTGDDDDDDNNDDNDDIFTSDHWEIEKISEEEDSIWNFVFGLDQLGHGHIAYYNTANQRKYLSNSTGSWVTSILDTDEPGGARMMDLAFTDGGHPVVAVCNGQHRVKMFYFEEDWTSETIAGAECGTTVNVDLSLTSALRIAYRDYLTNALLYREQTGDDWTSETVTTGAFNLDLLKDSAGTPFVVAENDEDLYCFEKTGTSWLERAVYDSAEGHTTGDSAWAVDDAGRVYTLFDVGVDEPDDPAEGLYYGDNVTGDWRFEKIVVVGYSRTMAIDGEGLVHFVYQAYSPSDLEGIVYAKGEYHAWTQEQVVDQIDARSGHLALDADDRPYVVFTDSSYKNLYLARRKEIPR